MSQPQSSKNEANIKPSIIVSIALSNLLSKKLRTGLTIFGIAIGIGAIYFLLSFGVGLQKLVTEEVIGNQSIKTIDVTSPNSKVLKIDDIAFERIQNIPNVSTVGKAYYFPGSYKIKNSESDSIVYGIDINYQKLTYLNLIKGKQFSETATSNMAFVNRSALDAAGLAKNPSKILGTKIEISVPLPKTETTQGTLKNDFQVIGVIDSGSGAEIFLPSSFFRDAGISQLSQVKVGVEKVEQIKKVRAQIESLGFETVSPVDTIDQINQVFKFLNIILVGFGSIGMIVAVLGMFNTLTISLLERTKEIGLMVALGARSVDMRKLFIVEALFLSFIGSAIGIFCAYMIGRSVNVVMNIFASKRGVQDTFDLFANPIIMVLGTILFMMFVGFIVVLLPARRAEKINPIDALRRE